LDAADCEDKARGALCPHPKARRVRGWCGAEREARL